MSTSPPTRKGPRRVPVKDRRAAPGAKGTTGSLRRLKGLLGRPLGLERRGGRLRVVLIDRRRASPADRPPSLSQLRAELRARLLAHEHDCTARVMRHFEEFQEMERSWVGTLPPGLVRADRDK